MSSNYNRLFIPLKSEAFNWFKVGKKWEIRRLNSGQYNLKNIKIGRTVELRKGYNGESIWGKVIDVKTFANGKDLIDNIGYKELIPTAVSKEVAFQMIDSFIDPTEQLIVFKIDLDLDGTKTNYDRQH